MKLGYVARITCSEELAIPTTLSNIDTLLETLSVMLLIYSIAKSSITVINEVEKPGLRSKLKRLYSRSSNDLQESSKKIINALTPEDDTNSRFKSIFPKNK